MASPLISLRDACVAHGDGFPPVLNDISIDVHRGDWIAIVGGNGSGKTTLLAALGGVLPLRSGRMERAPGARAALLLQEPDNQLVASSVARELSLSVPRDVGDAERRARIANAIERFELGGLLERNPHRLSGGEKQRLALATVWLEQPDVLLLDEPLSFLDDEMSERVISFVRGLNADGVAVLWATPGGEDAALARDVIELEDGRARRSGASAAETTPTLQPPRHAGPGTPPSRGDSRLRFDSVSFAYDDARVFDNLSLDARAGECVAITGRNGSGKSTLLLLAGGALQPSSGRVVRNTRQHGVLYLPQSPERLFFAATVQEEIAFGLERGGVARVAARERSLAAMEQAALEPVQFAGRSPFDLSFGEMRRVAFAIAFALQPELLLLDEPASCLDQLGTKRLAALVRDVREAGNTVVVTSCRVEPSGYPVDRLIRIPG